MTIRWDTVPIVFTTILHCPSCLATRPIPVRVQRCSDGSKSRKYVCRKCSKPFVLVVELPERLPLNGKVDYDI